MTFSRANPAGWALFELLTSSQMNEIDVNMSYALDGRDGGTFTPLAQLELDGLNVVAGDDTLYLKNTPTDWGLQIEVANGSGKGLRVFQSSASEANTNMMLVDATTVAYAPASPATSVILHGNANSLNDGGAALKSFGGDTLIATGIGGRGVNAVGGNGTVVGSYGGVAVDADAGDTNLTGLGGSIVATAAVDGTGSATVGDAATHWGGPGGRFHGGPLTGTGNGGPGMYATGALGPSASTSALDMGMGGAARGRTGLLGSTWSVDPFALPAELDAVHVQSGLTAFGKTYGRGLNVAFSGNSSSTDDFNKIAVVGVGSTMTGTNRSILNVETNLTSEPAALLTGVRVEDVSGLPNLRIRAFYGTGRGSPAYRADAVAAGGFDPPHIYMPPKTKPDSYTNGGLVFVNAAELTGLSDDALFCGSGSARASYDRVATSGDPCVVQAWARIQTNGSGGVVMGANYGMLTASIVPVLGVDVIQFVLDTISGQPASANMIAFGGIDALGYACSARVISSTLVQVGPYGSAGYADVTNQVFDIWVMVMGNPAFGIPADRPTYFVP